MTFKHFLKTRWDVIEIRFFEIFLIFYQTMAQTTSFYIPTFENWKYLVNTNTNFIFIIISGGLKIVVDLL